MSITTYKNTYLRYHKNQESTGDIWIIHGFSESGFTFSNAFESELAGQYNVWAPDLPGFGASPYQDQLTTLDDYIKLIVNMTNDLSVTSKIYLVGHSFGSVIATLVAEALGDKISGFVSVEGNLIQADSYFSGWAGQYEDAQQFHRDFKKLLYNQAKERPEFENYFALGVIADARAMLVLGRGSSTLTKGSDAADRYLALRCPTLYIWGDVDTPLVTQQYIKSNLPENYLFKACSHWMMKEQPELFYSILLNFFNQYK